MIRGNKRERRKKNNPQIRGNKRERRKKNNPQIRGNKRERRKKNNPQIRGNKRERRKKNNPQIRGNKRERRKKNILLIRGNKRERRKKNNPQIRGNKRERRKKNNPQIRGNKRGLKKGKKVKRIIIIIMLIIAGEVKGEIREIGIQEIKFDVEKREIKYKIDKPCYVRIRIGIEKRGAILRNLIDWEYREKGEHKEKWDGKEETRRIRIDKKYPLEMTIRCVEVDDKEELEKKIEFEVEYKKEKKSKLKNIKVFGEEIEIKIKIKKEDERKLRKKKYEIMIYINNQFLKEEEEGINPITYKIKTKGIRGINMITVNILGYGGRVGIRSDQFIIER